MENDKKYESVFTEKVRAGKRRTYFFDVRQTKGEDYYITLTESTKRYDGNGYERHKIFLYKEDFNRFVSKLQETVDHVKTELMPEFDYDEFTRRQAEWEEKKALGLLDDPRPKEDSADSSKEITTASNSEDQTPKDDHHDGDDGAESSEDDMSW